jgi:hypothetical protein
MRRECLVLVAPANHLFVGASVDPRNQRRQPGEQIGGRRERQQRSAAPLASTAKILSLTSNLALTLRGQMIWVRFRGHAMDDAVARRGPILFVKAKI